MRATRAAASLVALLATIGLLLVVPPASQAAETTRVTVSVTTSQPAAVGSSVTIRATVTPSTAAGQVAVTLDERPLATVPLSRGIASTTVRVQKAGQYLVRAAFTPTRGSTGATAASSSNMILVVGSVARLSVRDSAGRPIPAGAAVPSGARIRLVVAGFPARSRLTFTLGAATLPGSLTTDARGAGVLQGRVPGLAKGEYLVVAYGGQSTAVAPVVVDGVVPGATPTPTFCPATTPPPTESASPSPTKSTPKPTTSSPRPTKSTRPPTDEGKPTTSRSQSSSRDDDDDDDDGPGGGDLPRTGAAIASLLVLAGLAFAFGTGLISIGRRRPAGRHVR